MVAGWDNVTCCAISKFPFPVSSDVRIFVSPMVRMLTVGEGVLVDVRVAVVVGGRGVLVAVDVAVRLAVAEGGNGVFVAVTVELAVGVEVTVFVLVGV